MKKLVLVTAIILPHIVKAQNVGIGTPAPLSKLHVFSGASGATPFAFSPLVVESNGHTYINLLSPSANETAILFGQPGSAANGVLMYNNTSTPNGFQFRNNGNLTRMTITNNGNIGMGVTIPLARLHVSDSSVLFSASGDIPFIPGNTSISGGGRRMMWYPDKAAFRAGYTEGTHWDKDNIGNYSIAMGYSTTASGFISTAFGNFTTASEYGSTAMGYSTYATGFISTSMGLGTIAKAAGSLSIGSFNDNSDNPDPFSSDPADRIFQLGNGTGITRSNALTVLRNGYTGIGTISPAAMLDVTRGLVTTGTATAQFRGTQHISHFNYSLFENTYIRAGKDNGYVVLNDIPGGRVGIGTAAPGTTLHVLSGGSGYIGGNFPGITLEGNNNTYLNILVPNGNETGILFGKASDAASGGVIYNNSAIPNSLEFRTNGNSTKMVVRQNGNVGIGTNNPGALLEVNGYTKLGSDAPSIKVKKITSISAPTEGGYVVIGLDLDVSKILAVSVLVFNTGPGYAHWYGPNTGGFGVNYYWYLAGTALVLVNRNGDSNGILTTPVKITIVYEE